MKKELTPVGVYGLDQPKNPANSPKKTKKSGLGWVIG